MSRTATGAACSAADDNDDFNANDDDNDNDIDDDDVQDWCSVQCGLMTAGAPCAGQCGLWLTKTFPCSQLNTSGARGAASMAGYSNLV